MVEKTHTAAAPSAAWWPNVSQPLRNIGQKIADFFAPSADAAATESFYEVNVELPGVAAENIDVSVHDNTLMVKGEKHAVREEKGRTYFFSEREFGTFQRSFRLPADADLEGISADFTDGVLYIKVPKRGSASETARRIPVRKA